MPFKDGRRNDNKQKYMQTHLPRFMHTLLRASPHIQQGATMIAIGEKGHVPVLLHELFKPKVLKVTTTEFPGLLVLQDSLSNSTLQVELVQHNVETQPLPFHSESVDHVFFLEVLEHLEMDPFFAILEMHRVLKFNGTLFLSTPNLGSFTALARLHDGWSPYAFSKFLSNTEGAGKVTHIREKTRKPHERRPWQLYAYGRDFEFTDYPLTAAEAAKTFALEWRMEATAHVASLMVRDQQCKGDPENCDLQEGASDAIETLSKWAVGDKGWERLLSSVSLYAIARHAYQEAEYDEAIIALEESLALRLFAYADQKTLDRWQQGLVMPGSMFRRQKMDLANTLVLRSDCLVQLAREQRDVDDLTEAMELLQLATALLKGGDELVPDSVVAITRRASTIAQVAVELLPQLKTSRVKEVLERHGISCTGCSSKADYLVRLVPLLRLPVRVMPQAAAGSSSGVGGIGSRLPSAGDVPLLEPSPDPFNSHATALLKKSTEHVAQYMQRVFFRLLTLVPADYLAELGVSCRRQDSKGRCINYLPMAIPPGVNLPTTGGSLTPQQQKALKDRAAEGVASGSALHSPFKGVYYYFYTDISALVDRIINTFDPEEADFLFEQLDRLTAAKSLALAGRLNTPQPKNCNEQSLLEGKAPPVCSVLVPNIGSCAKAPLKPPRRRIPADPIPAGLSLPPPMGTYAPRMRARASDAAAAAWDSRSGALQSGSAGWSDGANGSGERGVGDGSGAGSSRGHNRQRHFHHHSSNGHSQHGHPHYALTDRELSDRQLQEQMAKLARDAGRRERDDPLVPLTLAGCAVATFGLYLASKRRRRNGVVSTSGSAGGTAARLVLMGLGKGGSSAGISSGGAGSAGSGTSSSAGLLGSGGSGSGGAVMCSAAGSPLGLDPGDNHTGVHGLLPVDVHGMSVGGPGEVAGLGLVSPAGSAGVGGAGAPLRGPGAVYGHLHYPRQQMPFSGQGDISGTLGLDDDQLPPGFSAEDYSGHTPAGIASHHLELMPAVTAAVSTPGAVLPPPSSIPTTAPLGVFAPGSSVWAPLAATAGSAASSVAASVRSLWPTPLAAASTAADHAAYGHSYSQTQDLEVEVAAAATSTNVAELVLGSSPNLTSGASDAQMSKLAKEIMAIVAE
eukprot:gene12473-12607_t